MSTTYARSAEASQSAQTRGRHWWGDRGVRTKVLAATLVGLLTVLIVGAGGISGPSSANDKAQELYRNAVTPLAPLGTLRDVIGDTPVVRDVANAGRAFAGLAAAREGYATAMDRRNEIEAAGVPATASAEASSFSSRRRATLVMILIVSALLALALGLAVARGPTRGVGRVRLVAEAPGVGNLAPGTAY